MDGPAPSGPHLSSVPGRAGADLVAVLAEAADLSGDVAAIDATELGFELLPLIGRDLAIVVADRCRARTLSVRLRGKVDADGPGALGADAVREVLRIEPIPDFGAARPGIRCLPVESMPQEDFVSLFARTFAPADLGLSGAHDLRAVAGDLHAGRAVQGRGDYQGLVVMAKSRPLGLFFLAGSGAVRELGFLGAVPAVRRRFALRAALAGGAAWMRADGISALTAEISTGNRRSLTLARRLGAQYRGLRLIYNV